MSKLIVARTRKLGDNSPYLKRLTAAAERAVRVWEYYHPEQPEYFMARVQAKDIGALHAALVKGEVTLWLTVS